MPRGDKPTTTALALKDGWIYEDALPVTISKEQYDWWHKESLILDGVRMGPPLPNPTDSGVTERPETVLLDRGDVLDAVALFCSHFETLGERFKKQLRNTIRAIPPSARRASVAAPQGDVFTAYNQAIEDAKQAIREEHVANPCEAPIYINAIARRCSPHRYIASLPPASTTQAGEVSAAPVVVQWLNEIESACNSALLDVYDQSIANAPVSPEYARGTADCIAHRVGQIREAVAAIRAAAAPLAAPVGADAEELARQIVGTVFDNTGASHETLKQVMIERITDAIVVGHISLPVYWARMYASGIESQNDLAGEVENWTDFHRGQVWAVKEFIAQFATAPAERTEVEGEPLTFRTTKEAMQYAQTMGIPAVIPATLPASTSDAARRAACEWMNTYHGAFKTNREREDALAAIISKHCPASSVAQSFIDAFRDTAIKCHIGFKHPGPWEECEWIECKDRRKMIESVSATGAKP